MDNDVDWGVRGMRSPPAVLTSPSFKGFSKNSSKPLRAGEVPKACLCWRNLAVIELDSFASSITFWNLQAW